MYFSSQFYFVANRYLLTGSEHFQKEQWHLLKATLLIGLFQKKIKTGAVAEDGGHFWKKPWNFRFVTLPLEIVNSREKKGSSPEILQNCGTLFLLLGNSNKAKNQDPWKLRMIFLDQLIPPRYYTSFLIDPWSFLMLFWIFLE